MSTENNYELQRQIAADVLTKAGDRAAAARREFDSKSEVKTDANSRNIVTKVESAVQEEVLTALKRIFPDYGVLSEKGEKTISGEYVWVLDAIDGPKNYARGLPLWGMSLALLRNNQAVVGAITIPDNGETYSASLSGQAIRNGVPIEVTQTRSLSDSIVSMTWGDQPHQRQRMLKAVEMLVPKASEVLAVGASAVALSWLAAGRVDAVVDNGDIWNFAAGFLIAKQMGAIVTEWDGSRPTYRERNFFTLVSTNQKLHTEIVEILKNK